MSDVTLPVNELSCAEVADLAGVYVLDALELEERQMVDAHLAQCPQPHPEFAELGGVVPALAGMVEPVDPPAALKGRIMAAVAADADAGSTRAASVGRGGAPSDQRPWDMPALGRRPSMRADAPRRSWLEWTAAAVAILLIAAAGTWGLTARADADRAALRTAELSNAIAALSEPGSTVAILNGSGAAAGARGFAAFPEDGPGYVVMVDLPVAPAGQTYQAWYIAGGAPSSAGLLSVGGDGYAILADARPVSGTEIVALTLEPAGGSAAPTADPIVVGEVATRG